MASEWGTSPQPKEAIMNDPYDHDDHCRALLEMWQAEDAEATDEEIDDYSDYHCDSAMEAGLFGSEA
jgi:hypothetical protein